MSASGSDVTVNQPPGGGEGAEGNSDGFWITIIVIIVVLALILLGLMLFVFYYKLKQRDKEMAKELEEREKRWEERRRREDAARKYAESPTANGENKESSTATKNNADQAVVNMDSKPNGSSSNDKKREDSVSNSSKSNSTTKPTTKKVGGASDSARELPAFSNLAEASPPTTSTQDEDRPMASSQLSSSTPEKVVTDGGAGRNQDLKSHQPPPLSTPPSKNDRRPSVLSSSSRRSSQQSQQSIQNQQSPPVSSNDNNNNATTAAPPPVRLLVGTSLSTTAAAGSLRSAAAADEAAKTSMMSAVSVRTAGTADSTDTSTVVQTPQHRKAKPTLATFKKGKLLGSGAFGRVYMGLDETTGGFVAAKEVSFSDFDQPDMMSASQGGSGGTEKRIKALAKEIAVMKRLSHANIVNYLGADRKGTDFYIFMEYLPGGSLRGTIDSFGKLAPRLCTLYLKQALRGLSYLHGQHVVHRDVKAANMLLDKNGCVKLADFGCSQSFESIESMRGTPYWLAPEVVRSERGIGAPSDIWSMGCVLMEMLTGQTPWYWLGNAFAVMNAVAGAGTKLQQGLDNMPDEITSVPWACDFITQCCNPDSTARPSAVELLEHPLVTGFASSGSFRRESDIPVPTSGDDDPIDTPQPSSTYTTG